jgi:hypothetical protein
MGGIGSGRHRGGRNTAEACAKMRAGMRAAHRVKASQPADCEECGAPGHGDLNWHGEVDENGKRKRKWKCGSCLSGPIDPLRIEDFARSGTTNLNAAAEHEIATEHGRGPQGDAVRKRKVIG